MSFQCYVGVVVWILHTPVISNVAEAFDDVIILNTDPATNT